jgi:hypothetical protein
VANKYITTTGSGSKTGADWANAYDLAAWNTYLGTLSSGAGDSFFFEEGTYTLTGNISYGALNGTNDTPFKIIGVKSGTTAEPPTQADWSDKTDRPLFACGANLFVFNDDWQIYNCQYTASGSRDGVRLDGGCLFYNVKVTLTGSSASNAAIAFGTFEGMAVGCELIASASRGIRGNEGSQVFNCFFNTCLVGVYMPNGNWAVVNNIFDDCGLRGIDLATNSDNNLIVNNTINDATRGIEYQSGATAVILNNALTNNSVEAIKHATASHTGGFIDWNNYSGNTTDVTNVTKGGNATANAPSYTDAAGQDFSLGTSSAMREAGRPLDIGVG